jgi:ribosomal protein S27AE
VGSAARSPPQQFHAAVAVVPFGNASLTTAKGRDSGVRREEASTMTTAPTRAKPPAWGHAQDYADDYGHDHAREYARDHADAQARACFRSQRPKCPDCGDVVLLADHARFNLAGRIDHVWSCDDCGNEFVTSISLARPLAV